MANSIQQLSQQAMGIAGQFFPGASLLSGPKVATRGGLPFAEQEYQTARIRAWNGMWMKGEFYFAVLAIARPQRYAEVRKAAQELMQTAVFQGLQRNMNLEGALLGSWSKSSYSATRTGVRDKSNYSANWTVRFFPGNRFESTQENYFDTTSEVYGGGNVGSSNRATGTYRIFGMTMVADMDGGAGRQLFQLEPYPNGQAIKVNGQLFLRN